VSAHGLDALIHDVIAKQFSARHHAPGSERRAQSPSAAGKLA
jgi:hypothetical protein